VLNQAGDSHEDHGPAEFFTLTWSPIILSLPLRTNLAAVGQKKKMTNGSEVFMFSFVRVIAADTPPIRVY